MSKGNKKYYWLKLKDDFFNQKEIKKLRKIAGGDTYTIIYLKMQLKSIKNNGILEYEGIEDNFYEELALDLDEDIENVKLTVIYLVNHKLLEKLNNEEYFLTKVNDCIGKESESAERVRKHRALKESKMKKALQCNINVTNCNTEIEKEKEIEIEEDDDDDLLNIYTEIGLNFEDIDILPEESKEELLLHRKVVKDFYNNGNIDILNNLNLNTLTYLYNKISNKDINDKLQYFRATIINYLKERENK